VHAFFSRLPTMDGGEPASLQEKIGYGLLILLAIALIALLVYRFVVKGKSCPSGYTGSKCDWIATGPADSGSADAPGGPVKAGSVLDCADMCKADSANCVAAVFDGSSGMCYKKPKLDNLNNSNAYTLVWPTGFQTSV